MKRLLQTLGFALAVLWVPVTSHCAWENVSGLQFFKCATDTPENSDCDGDGCAQLEKATYKTSDPQVTPSLPLLTLLFQVLVIEPAVSEQSILASAPPPEIPAGWQFSFRTALPPRAPSFVS